MTSSNKQKEIAKKIDAITEQQKKCYKEQEVIHRRLMILKERRSKLVTEFVKLS